MNNEIISLAIAANIPLLIKGAPGMGKTSYVTDLAEQHGASLQTVIASLRDPSDFGGLPVRVQKDNDISVFLAPPLWARLTKSAADEGREAWVFFDEITTAAPATQAALLRVILDRQVGDLELPSNVRMIAAANPPDQAAGGWDLAPPLANRFIHVDWSVLARDWAEGFMQGFPMPSPIRVKEDDIDLNYGKTKALVAGYIQSKGLEALINVPKDDSKAGGAWPSPRTWDMATRLVATRKAAKMDDDIDSMLLRGTIGEGEAISFLAWLKEQNLPNPRELLKHASDFELPERGDIVFTVLNSVVAEAISTGPKPEDWLAAWEILKRAGEQGAFDVGAAAAKNLASHGNSSLPPANDFVKPYIDMLVEADLVPAASKNVA